MQLLLPFAPVAVAYFLVFNPIHLANSIEVLVALISLGVACFVMSTAGSTLQRSIGAYSERQRWCVGLALLFACIAYYLSNPVTADYPIRGIAVAVRPSAKPAVFPVVFRQAAQLPINCFWPKVQSIRALDEDDDVPHTLAAFADRLCIDTKYIAPEPFRMTLIVDVSCSFGAYSLSRQLDYAQTGPDRFEKSAHARVTITPRCGVVSSAFNACEAFDAPPRKWCTD